MRTCVQQWEDSLAVRIPPNLAAACGLVHDMPVEVLLVDGRLVVSPVTAPALTLERLLAGVTEHNLHHEVNTGPAVGNEVW